MRKLEVNLSNCVGVGRIGLPASRTLTPLITSREEANNLELLTDVILSHWKPLEIDYKTLVLSEENRFLTQTQAGFAYYY